MNGSSSVRANEAVSSRSESRLSAAAPAAMRSSPYSSTYPLSNPCQQEITTAWLAAQHLDQNANRRVWIVNPESSFERSTKSVLPSIPALVEEPTLVSYR